MKFTLLKHLKLQAKEREIDIKMIESTLTNPQQIVPEPKGLKVAQTKYINKKENKEYLIRVIFREDKDSRIGITVYKTLKNLFLQIFGVPKIFDFLAHQR